MSTWLITGCSTGLGRAIAEAVIGAGHNAVVTARDATKVADLADAGARARTRRRPRRHRPRAGRLGRTAGRGALRRHRRPGQQRRLRVSRRRRRRRRRRRPHPVRDALLRHRRDDQSRPARHAVAAQRRHREHLLDRRTADPGRIGLLRGGQSRHRGPQRSASRRTRPARHLGDRGRARRVSHRLRRPLTRPIGHGHRRLREHRGAASQRERHHARHSGRRPGQGRRGDHRGRRIKPSPPASCCWAPTPWPPTATSPTGGRTRSPTGKRSPRAPISTPDPARFRSGTNARTMDESAISPNREGGGHESRSRRLPGGKRHNHGTT